MALPSRTLDEWVSRAIGNFRTSFRGYPLGAKKFLGRIARALGMLGWQLHKAVEDVDKDIVPSPQSSTDALSSWAEEYGLPDGQGGYGRLKATAATGGVATLTGVNGTVFEDGATATAEDGTTVIQLSGAVTIAGSPPGFGSITGQFVAVTTGAVSNLPAGTVCNWDNAPPGADTSFKLTSGLEGGADTESNAALFARLVERLQTPPRGGVEEDYRLWTSAAAAGVRAWVYPKRSGTGSVDLVLTQTGSGQGRKPTTAQLDAVGDYIATKRPADVETINLLSPYMPNAGGHAVIIQIRPSSSKYAFDWDDTGGTYLVDTAGYSAGPPATITLTGLAPESLKTAITGYIAGLNLAPRLQVMSTGAVYNAPIRAVDYVDGGGKTTLTLESLPDDWVVPTDGDRIYADGPAVQTIAAGIVALCDSLGPSRVSGFGDAITPWQDTLTVSGIIGIAESAVDTDGSKFIERVVGGGVTIDGLPGDVQGDDSVGEPELLFLSSVAVIAAA